jgi:hypothetical protein
MIGDRITDLAHTTGGAGEDAPGDGVGSVGDTLGDRFRAAQGAAGAAYGQARNAARTQVSEQPMLALVLAGLTGYALALLTTSRR